MSPPCFILALEKCEINTHTPALFRSDAAGVYNNSVLLKVLFFVWWTSSSTGKDDCLIYFLLKLSEWLTIEMTVVVAIKISDLESG